jgi:hypothetical protein
MVEYMLGAIALVEAVIILLKPWSRLHSRIDVHEAKIKDLDLQIMRLSTRIDTWEDRD